MQSKQLKQIAKELKKASAMHKAQALKIEKLIKAMPKKKKIMKDFTLNLGNIIWIIGIIFTMGIAYSQIAQLSDDIEVVEARLEKKIKLVNECEDRIVELEKELIRLQQTEYKRKR